MVKSKGGETSNRLCRIDIWIGTHDMVNQNSEPSNIKYSKACSSS